MTPQQATASVCLYLKSIEATDKATKRNNKVQMAAMQQQMASITPGVLSCRVTALFRCTKN